MRVYLEVDGRRANRAPQLARGLRREPIEVRCHWLFEPPARRRRLTFRANHGARPCWRKSICCGWKRRPGRPRKRPPARGSSRSRCRLRMTSITPKAARWNPSDETPQANLTHVPDCRNEVAHQRDFNAPSELWSPLLRALNENGLAEILIIAMLGLAALRQHVLSIQMVICSQGNLASASETPPCAYLAFSAVLKRSVPRARSLRPERRRSGRGAGVIVDPYRAACHSQAVV
jgi:hypothetical protein